MNYKFDGVGCRYSYELRPEGIAVVASETFGSAGEQTVPYGLLLPTPSRSWVRDAKLLDRIILVSVVVMLLPVAFLLIHNDFGLWKNAKEFMLTWFAAGVVICIAAAIRIRRIEWAVFSYATGPVALGVGCTPGKEEAFHAFVKALEQKIRDEAARSQTQPNS